MNTFIVQEQQQLINVSEVSTIIVIINSNINIWTNRFKVVKDNVITMAFFHKLFIAIKLRVVNNF